jgi:hypothetical protein
VLGQPAQPALLVAGGDQLRRLCEGTGLAASAAGLAAQALVQLPARLGQDQGA